MRNLIVLIFLCVFVSTIHAQSDNITASVSGEIDYDFNIDPKWPDCLPPKVVIEISNISENSHLHIQDFNDNIEYSFLAVNKLRQDSLFLERDELFLNDDLFAFNVFAKAECGKNLSSKWSKVKISKIQEDSRNADCIISSHTHYFHKLGQINDILYITFADNFDEGTLKTNNIKYNGHTNQHINFHVEYKLLESGAISTKQLFSNVSLNDMGIMSNATNPYFFIFTIPKGWEILNVGNVLGSTQDCESFVNSDIDCFAEMNHCTANSNVETLVNTYGNATSIIDVNAYFCSVPEPICEYTTFIEGEINDNDLILSFNGVTQTEFQQQIDETKISKIDINITGISASGEATTTIPFWEDSMTNFNIANWQETVSGYGNYTSFIVTLNVYDKGGDIVSCNTFSEIPVTIDTKVCDILGLLKIHSVNDTKVKFDFTDEDNSNHLVEGLQSIGYTIAQAETYIESQLNYLNFNLSYSNGLQYISSTQYVNLQSGIDLSTFSVELDVNSIENFSGALQLEYTDINGKPKNCLLSPLNISVEEDEEENGGQLPLLDCSSVPNDLSNMSTELKPEVLAGQVYSINSFPLLILSINPGQTNATGFSGEGLIPIPFEQKQLFVELVNIQINVDGQVISGKAIGKNGPGINTFPDFNLPPLYIGGDICIPPPTNSGLNGDGIDPATGLTGYGFDPNTGKHHITGTEYDPNGYDQDGNHSGTGEIWNDDGCTRDGILYEENPDTGEMENTGEECDPTGGAADPQALSDFKNALNPVLTDSIHSVYYGYWDLLTEMGDVIFKECDDIRKILKNSDLSINSPLAYGESDVLINLGMRSKFEQEPKELVINGGRDNIPKNTEKKHIELYNCEGEYTELVLKIENIAAVEDQLDKEIKEEIEKRIDELTSNELTELQDPIKLGNWILAIIKEYVTEETGQSFGYIDSIEDNYFNKDIKKSMSYDAIASIEDFVGEKGSDLDAMNFEYKQGFKEVMGYPRPIVTEALRKHQLSMNVPMIQSLLPINIDKSTSRFDISILISGVVFFPTSATMDVACVITDKYNNNQKLAFGGQGLPLAAGAVNEESAKLFLLNDVGIRLNNASRLQLKSGADATYVKWDCNGFAGMYIKGAIQFCREYVLPLDDADQVISDPNVLYELVLNAYYPGLLEFDFSVEAPPFELTTMRGYKWEIGMMGVDFTTSTIPNLDITIPKNYNSVYFNKETQKLDDLWKGFYATGIKLTLPKDLFGNGTNTYSAEVDNMIIDDTGLTALVTVGNDPGLISWDEGNANGWQMSVEDMNLLILQNSIAGGGFGGRIGLAVLKDPLDYSATIYNGGVLFSVSPDTSASFTPLGNIDVKLFKNSYIQGEFNDDGFFAKAHLHGTLTFGGDDQNEELAILKLPNLSFQGLEFENYKKETGGNALRFSAGTWGIVTPDGDPNNDSNPEEEEEDKALMSGFGVSITELSVHSNSTDDGLFLRVGANVDLIKETLNAGGSFEIHGKLDENESIFKMKYDKFKVNELEVDGSIKGIMSLNGFVQWYDDSKSVNKFGKGFRGGLSIELEKLFPGVGITTAAQFGKVTKNEEEHDYYFVDMVGDFGPVALTLGPVTFNKFGGGMSKGMYPDYTKITPQPGFLTPSQLREEPLGTTLTGIQYVPDVNSGYEFKLMTGFYCGKEDIFNGTGELIVRLTTSNSLSEIEIRAQGQFLSIPDVIPYDAIADVASAIPNALESIDSDLVTVEDIPKPTTSATLSGFASFRYNFVKKEFKGNVAAYLNMPGGLIKGTGSNGALVMVDIFFGKKDWWIWVGEPTAGKRAGMLIDLDVLEASLQAYFDIGTKIPPFPGLPARVRHLGQDLNLNESNRASSFAFAFGASFDLDINASVAGTGVEIGVGAGYDMMLRKYEDVLCDTQDGPEEIGMDGWYAMGQAWAYIDGKIKVFGFNIAEAGIATVLQMQTPNPTWGLAALEVYYKVLWHEGTWKGDVEFGERCQFTSSDPDNEFGMNIIVGMDPENNLRDFGLDGNVSANFVLPLGDTIVEYAFFEGDPRPLTFDLNTEKTGLFNEEGRVDCNIIVDKHINSIVFKPTDFLKPDDSLWFVVEVDIYDDYDFHSTQFKTVGFRTANELETIPKSNVKYSYPSDGMTNFFTEQNANQIGYVQLQRGQANIFYKDEIDSDGNITDFKVKAKFTSENGQSFYKHLTYNPMTFLLQYEMPANEFIPSTMYKMEIVRIADIPVAEVGAEELGNKVAAVTSTFAEDKVLMELYFRTSEHKSLLEKVNSIVENNFKSGKDNHQSRSLFAEDESISLYIKTKQMGFGEVFDVFDLNSNGNGKPYVEMVANTLENIYNPASLLLDNNVFISYDNQFWPSEYEFTEFKGYGFAGISPNVVSTDIDYSISKILFENKDFDVKTGLLKVGFFELKSGARSLKITYNYPDGTKDIHEDLILPNHLDNTELIKKYGAMINVEPAMVEDVTGLIQEYIENTND